VTISLTRADPSTRAEADASAEWWRSAAIYQVYVRSFADGNGDGVGDLAGVRKRLSYIRDLGIDAIWFTPWYASPLIDGGYDVEDYREIHPDFGTVAEAELLIAEASAVGIRTIVDIVPNHISSRHRWFQEALASAPGSDARARFWFRDGLGENGDVMPTQWPSSFSGTTWTRTTNPDGSPGQWYLHLFAAEQPDLNWNHPDVRAEHEEILRFWFDRGVAGVRIDSAALVAKDPNLPEIEGEYPSGQHPNFDRDELHDIYRGWRTIADSYSEARLLVGEIWLADLDRFALYLRQDELHMAFNFDFMARPWSEGELRAAINETLRAHKPVDATATWVLSNHDITRPVTRYGREDSAFAFASKRFGTPTDLELGNRRARAAALLTGALPGALYIYQGDELGLPEVEDLPRDRIEDPMHFRSNGIDPGRDGCRVPLPWSGTMPPYGFSSTDSIGDKSTTANPWLPQPLDWAALTVDAQRSDPESMLTLYTDMLHIRREFESLRDGDFSWIDSADGLLMFARGADFVCVTNFSTHPIPLPAHTTVLLTSASVSGGVLPPDSTAWLKTQR
jgi:alpha-glucosidase